MSAAPAVARIFAAFQVLVHQRSAVLQRLFDREYRGQFFVLDFDQLERCLRLLPASTAATAATMSPT